MHPLILTSMAAASTSLGGCCAVLLQRRVHALMAFGSGVLMGAAFLDLLPSAVVAAARSGTSAGLVFSIAVLGGLLVFAIAKVSAYASANRQRNRAGGRVSATLLILHSALDGTVIFAASTISLQVGLIVGLGVVAHDVCDGLNTILLSTGGRRAEGKDYCFLAMDALAPVAGGLIAAHLFTVSPKVVMVLLSLAAGSFVFTALFSLLPDAWRRGRRRTVSWIAMGGFVLIWCLTRLTGALS